MVHLVMGNGVFLRRWMDSLFSPVTTIIHLTLALPSFSPQDVGIQVQVFIFVWCLPPFLSREPAACFDWEAASVGGPVQCSPVPQLRAGNWSETMWWCVWVQGLWGTGVITLTASCLPSFLKAANLSFVSSDSSDKQEGKWRILWWEQDQVR